nr:reverse transcriptase domain-containing protein [Tanacetum cinerariifolium]
MQPRWKNDPGRLGVAPDLLIRRSQQPFILEESPVDTMADQRTMAELLRAPTEAYAEAIVVLPILAEQFELKHSLINMMTSDQFFELEKDNPHDYIRWGSPLVARKRTLPFIHTWEDLAWDRYKDLLRACPHYDFTELHQLDTFYNALNPADHDSLNAAVGSNLLERRTQDVLTIIENKCKVHNFGSKSIVSQVKACDVNPTSFSEIAKLTHAANQQMSVVTTAMMAILKQFQATPPPASVKAVEETCVTYGGAHPYYQCLAAGGNIFPELRDNIQGYFLAAAVHYNQAQQNQNVHLNELEKVRRMNEANMKAMQTQIDMVKNELRNEMKISIQTSLKNQTNEIKNMMASLLQMNTASTSGSGSLPSNTVANPKGELKAITTRSGLVIDGPTIPTPTQSINLEVDERVEETFTDSNLAEYTIKVPPPPKMLKSLLSNKEKLQELANTPLNENCSAVILKKLPEKLGDPEKFLIPCGFSELKCKALADLGVSINLMPLSIWKKLGLPELNFTHMTLELANRAICTPAGIARDVFVLVGKFTFLAGFIIVDYESNPRVLLILGRSFLRTAHALIDIHGEEMILRDGDERLILNMRHDTSCYSNQPQKESINLINVFNNLKGSNVLSEKLIDLGSTKDLHPPLYDDTLSGNATFSSNSLLEEFANKLIFPLKYNDDLQFDIEFDLKEIEFMHYQDIDSSLKDSIDLANRADNVVDSVPEMFTVEHALDYSSPLIFDEYDDDFLEIESDAENVYDDPFDSKREKIKESKLLISLVIFFFTSMTRLSLRIFPGLMLCPQPITRIRYLTHVSSFKRNFFEIITRVVQDKKLATSNASWMLKDFDPPFYEPFFFKEVPSSKMLLPFSSENKEKVFKPGYSRKFKDQCRRILSSKSSFPHLQLGNH